MGKIHGGNVLEILDYGTITKPTAVIAIDDYLYVTLEAGSLLIYDISDPTSLTLDSTFSLMNGFGTRTIKDLTIDNTGNYLYAIDSTNNKIIPINITTRNSPSIGTENGTFVNQAKRIVSQGDYVYIAHNTNFTIHDISTRNAPSWTNPPGFTISGGTSGQIYDLDVQGDYLYLVYATNKFSVADVSDLTVVPPLIGTLDNSSYFGYPTGVCVKGDYCYVADNTNDQVTLVNVTSPASPSIIGAVSSFNGAVDVITYEERLYVSVQLDYGIAELSIRYPPGTYTLRTSYDSTAYGLCTRSVRYKNAVYSVSAPSNKIAITYL